MVNIYSISEYIPQRIESRHKWVFVTHVHSNLIHNSQKVEANPSVLFAKGCHNKMLQTG